MAGYHVAEIFRGKFGEFGKIREEFEEAQDSHSQGNRLMLLQELSDLLGAIEKYLETEFKGAITMEDLTSMKDATARAFSSGHRTPHIEEFNKVVKSCSPRIDYEILSRAVSFYKNKGYCEISVPWIVGNRAYRETKPVNSRDFATFAGNLVASAEQSLMQGMIDGWLHPGKYFCVTPCFRDEKTFDDIHLACFMKLELINYKSIDPDRGLQSMIEDAKRFMCVYCNIEELETEQGVDIVAKKTKMELGSYGLRSMDDHQWVYGTGCALPRLSQAMGR